MNKMRAEFLAEGPTPARLKPSCPSTGGEWCSGRFYRNNADFANSVTPPEEGNWEDYKNN